MAAGEQGAEKKRIRVCAVRALARTLLVFIVVFVAPQVLFHFFAVSLTACEYRICMATVPCPVSPFVLHFVIIVFNSLVRKFLNIVFSFLGRFLLHVFLHETPIVIGNLNATFGRNGGQNIFSDNRL